MLYETRRNCEREIFALAFLANPAAGHRQPDLGLHENPVHFSTILYLYFGGLCPADLIWFPLLHVKSDFEAAAEDPRGAVSPQPGDREPAAGSDFDPDYLRRTGGLDSTSR